MIPPKFILISFLLALMIRPAAAAETPDGYITVVDSRGFPIFRTGLPVLAGDRYIDENDRLFEITQADSRFAQARLSSGSASSAIPAEAAPSEPGSITEVPPDQPAEPPAQSVPSNQVALYYTHTDESYIPSDGKAAVEGNGGIFQVGAAFASRLGELGFQVDNDQTRHDPHDANAYQRSRRTFLRLLGQGPLALFDFHRDSAPLEDYQTQVQGQPAARILLVVGNQNQNRNTSLNYAKSIKAASDEKYRGLVRGIFIARGNYNQDLSPHALLVEVGTQYNSRESAERSAALFADIIAQFLSSSQPPPENATGGTIDTLLPGTPGSGLDILTILAVTFVGSGLYLLFSTSGWNEAKRHLRRLRDREFANFLGPRRKK